MAAAGGGPQLMVGVFRRGVPSFEVWYDMTLGDTKRARKRVKEFGIVRTLVGGRVYNRSPSSSALYTHHCVASGEVTFWDMTVNELSSSRDGNIVEWFQASWP